ncbi:MAG: hypothetical protein ICV66_03300 [Chitinophagaceae bacterium]|nr:hypothetical protein [Chitinophagaceae bacterium]
MIKKLSSEVWKPLHFSGSTELRNKYAISSYGRIASYKDDVLGDGKLLKGSLTTGYTTLNLHRPGRKGTLYIHREVAKLFVPRSSAKHKFVIHKNHDKLYNSAKNLKWATQEQMVEHQQKSPAKLAYKEQQANRKIGLKLTASQVKTIKRQLTDERRSLTIRQLADKYDVSEMTMYRIKSGENWARIEAKA